MRYDVLLMTQYTLLRAIKSLLLQLTISLARVYDACASILHVISARDEHYIKELEQLLKEYTRLLGRDEERGDPERHRCV